MNQKLKEQMCGKIIGEPMPLTGLAACFFSLAILGIGITILNDISKKI